MDSLLLIHNDLEKAGALSSVFNQAAPDVVLSVARDTQEVRRHPIPAMILLDLDHGSPFAILQWLKCTEGYEQIPVIALASSADSSGVNEAYKFGANSCVLKREGEIASEVARGIGTYLRVLKSHAQTA